MTFNKWPKKLQPNTNRSSARNVTYNIVQYARDMPACLPVKPKPIKNNHLRKVSNIAGMLKC